MSGLRHSSRCLWYAELVANLSLGHAPGRQSVGAYAVVLFRVGGGMGCVVCVTRLAVSGTRN